VKKKIAKSKVKPVPVIEKILYLAKQAHAAKVQFNDKWLAEVKKQHVGKISCFKCKKTWCCTQLVLASLFEGVLIAQELMNQRAVLVLKRLAELGRMQGKLLGRYESTEADESGKASARWFDLQFACPLLVDDRCSVYALRPTACVAHLVAALPENCSPPSGKIVGHIDCGGPVINTLMQDAIFSKEGLNLAGVASRPLPLGTAVAYGSILLREGPQELKRFVHHFEGQVKPNQVVADAPVRVP